MNSPATGQPARIEYLDLIRGVFILVMIEGHTLRLFLSEQARATAAFQYQELIHNLTGPVFLFASGTAFVYSSFSRRDDYRRWSARLLRRLARWLIVLVAGYALQLTFGSLGRTLAEGTPEQLVYLLSLNILQCIVYSLLLLQMLLWLTPGWRSFTLAAGVAGLGIALLAPLAWEKGGSAAVWLAPMLSGNTSSIFPLFPYAAYALAGAAWGYFHQGMRRPGGEAAFLRRSGWIACGLTAAAFLSLQLLPRAGGRAFWETSFRAFLLRIGILVLMAVIARALEDRLLPAWRWLAVVGEQSLLIYVVHLLALYGSAFNPDTSLRKALGVPLDLGATLVVCVAFGVAMAVLALWWEGWSRRHPRRAKGVWWVAGGYYCYRFFLT